MDVWGFGTAEEGPGFCLAVVLVDGSIVCSHVGGVYIKSYYRVFVCELLMSVWVVWVVGDGVTCMSDL